MRGFKGVFWARFWRGNPTTTTKTNLLTNIDL
jgi:hypothetical protein